MSELDVATCRELRPAVTALGVEPQDLLAYEALAEGAFGLHRVVAVFPLAPISTDATSDPVVLCLDGPRGLEASEHRHSETHLCLWFKDDPSERRWTLDQGLHRLFAVARQHLVCEHYVRTTGRPWPIDEAPHGATTPAEPAPELMVALPRRPGRNDECPCGSNKKAKNCCYR